MRITRAKTVYINSIVAVSARMIQIILGFFVRKVFVQSLGASFLGYEAVFSNILQMLNLADLGIGVAITSFLFKPLSESDSRGIAALLNLYKKIYRIIGICIVFVGIVISVFLGLIVPDAEIGIWDLRILFYISLMSSASTYFLAYKRILLSADQKAYIINSVDSAASAVFSIAQIVALSIAPDYRFFLILNVLKSVASNVIISFCTDKIYGKIDRNAQNEEISYYTPRIWKYVREVIVSRVGAMIYYTTDNVIISAIKGSVLAGLLSNYTMITNVLISVVNQLLASIQGTFGNYVSVNKDSLQQKEMTDYYFCANFLIGLFLMHAFTLMAQPFVQMMFGQNMVLPFSTVVWLGVNLLLTVMIQLPSQVFIVYKLFRYDRPVIIVSASLNIIISVALVKQIGINGALAGTFVTSLIYLLSRFYIISRFVYHVRYRDYIMTILVYFAIAAGSLLLTYCAVAPIRGETAISFLLRGFIVVICSVVFPSALLAKTKSFSYLVRKFLPGKMQKVFSPCPLRIAAGIILIIVLVTGSVFA